MMAVEGPVAEFAQFVVGRIVQGMHAQVAPIAVEAQRGGGGAGAGDFEHAAGQIEAGAGGGHLGGGHGNGHIAAATGIHGLSIIGFLGGHLFLEFVFIG